MTKKYWLTILGAVVLGSAVFALVMVRFQPQNSAKTVLPTLMVLPSLPSNAEATTAPTSESTPTAVTITNQTVSTVPPAPALVLAAQPAVLAVTPLPTVEPVSLAVPQQPVPEQIVLRFDPASTEQERANYIQQLGGIITDSIDTLDTVVVNVPQGVASQPLPPASIVQTSEPDYFVVALDTAAVNDLLYPQQWALPVIGAPDAWSQMPLDTAPITVAVIDSGICAEHPDLEGRILPGYDFVEDDAIPQDNFGHGCGVAGVIAANADNGEGIAGVAPNTRIMPLRVLNSQGIGTYSDVAAALVYAADHDAQIINLSLGGQNSSSVLEDAVDYAVAQGALVIAAAGNTGGSVLYPAAYEPVIAVASVDADLQRSSFSSYGPEIDLLAPGRDILTTHKEGDYAMMSGTSFAAPHVAAIAVLEAVNGRRLILHGGVVKVTNLNQVVTLTSSIVISPTPEPTIFPTTTSPVQFVDWQQYRDTENGYGLAIPAFWIVYPASNDGIISTATLLNYDPNQLTNQDYIPSGGIKVDLQFHQAASDITLEQWLYEYTRDILVVPDQNNSSTEIELVEPSTLGVHPVVRVQLRTLNGSSFSLILLRLDSGKVVTIRVEPLAALVSSDVQAILNSIAISNNETVVIPSISPSVPILAETSLTNPLVIHDCSWGDEVQGSPIFLHMPFTPGTTWTVGGNGSYYGDGMHTSNDYYSTDWNMGSYPNNVEDYGQAVYPVANGIAYFGTDPNNPGYGNWVDIYHGNNSVRTRYAHLSKISISAQGIGVDLNTKIGEVGSTGAGSNNHLHLSFWVYTNGAWNSRYGQGRRPSPMQSVSGLWELCDSQSRTVANKPTFLASDINRDGIVDLSDYSILVKNFLKLTSNADDPNSDINKDGIIDISDYSILVRDFFRTTSTSLDDIEAAAATVVLRLAPTTTVTVGQEFDVQIEVAAGSQPVVGIQSFLNFDPTRLRVVNVTPGTTLTDILRNSYNNSNGRIDFAAGKQQEPAPDGTFTLATVRFRALAATSGTAITFNRVRPRESAAVYEDEALLGSVENGQIKILSTVAAPIRNRYTTHTPLLTWSRVSWATAYEIQIDDNSNFSSPRHSITAASGSILSLTSPSLPNGTWYWRARARRSNGTWGPWSAHDEFAISVS